MLSPEPIPVSRVPSAPADFPRLAPPPCPPEHQRTLFEERPLTVEEVLDWHITNNPKQYAPDAHKERRRVWSLFRAKFGTRVYYECRPFELLEWIQGHKGLKSAWTRKRWNATIQAAFNAACRLGLIGRNPFKGIRMPEGGNGRDWTDDEYRTLLRESNPYFRRMLIFVRFSGARPGEARQTRWPHVKMDAQAIINKDHKTAWATAAPRRIPFNHVLVKLLIWLKRNNPPACDHIFLNGYGRAWTCKALTKHLLKLRRRLGISDEVKMHGGRHTFATHAIMNGVDLGILAEILGHRRLQTTQKYVHMAGKLDHLNAAMERAVKSRRPAE